VRTLVVGDIHGCLDEFKELLKVADFRHDTDRLLLLGDLVDRGPDSAGVVRFARELKADCILGNHEEKHLRWRKYTRAGGKNPMRSFTPERLAIHASFSDADWAFLESLPLHAEIAPGWLAVHGGLEPQIPFADQRPNALLRCRWVDKVTGKMKAIDPEEPEVIQPPSTIFWADVWPGPENVVYGHHVHSKEQPYFSRPRPGVMCVGIDTGGCFGGKLTGMIFDNQSKVVDVVAVDGKAYADWKKMLVER
jgi:hypothetical protein